jgi:hypothetical protein
MPNGLFRFALCSLLIAGEIHAQEVIVAREKKPETAAQSTPPPEQIQSESPAATPPAEQTQLESPTPLPSPAKRKSHEKKSSSTALTLEQMRKAGAEAAERLESPNPPPAAKTSAPEEPRAVAEPPIITATPRPQRREARAEETRPSHRSSAAGPKPETVGPIRPTMMENGREEPSATP